MAGPLRETHVILDAHSHVHDPLDVHLSALDDAGVDRAVLFPTRAHPERATDLDSLRGEMGALERALAGGSGDDGFALAMRELDEALAAHPDRFVGFGSVPLGRPDAETAARVGREEIGRGLYGLGELTPPPDRRHWSSRCSGRPTTTPDYRSSSTVSRPPPRRTCAPSPNWPPATRRCRW
jgi:hypothetical protein